MDVIICEDDPKQLEEITRTIGNYAVMEDNGINVVLSTTNPAKVLAYAQNNKADCYFFDIDLNHELTGIELGSKIRLLDPIGNIIFITSHSEMTYLTYTYKVAALDFIIKDDRNIMHDKVLDALKEAHKRYRQIGKESTVKKLQLQIGRRVRNIAHHDIYFFEVSPNSHKLVLHFRNEQMEFYGRLKHYEKLGENFYRCHKGYIVNKDHIHEVDTKERIITMTNGAEIQASSRLVKGLL